MIDLDGLEEHLKEIIDDGRGGERYTKAENVMALVQCLRQAEKDAKRYRWLRDDADGHQLRGCMELNGEDWDAAVDRVMQCK